VIVESSNGNIFGGYTSCKWTGFGHKADKSAFLFVLKNPKMESCKIVGGGKRNDPGIYCNTSRLAIFCGAEGDEDLWIKADCDENTESSSILGMAYRLPHGADSTLFAGAKNFMVKEIEVYGVL